MRIEAMIPALLIFATSLARYGKPEDFKFKGRVMVESTVLHGLPYKRKIPRE